jgi:hypothetical protein
VVERPLNWGNVVLIGSKTTNFFIFDNPFLFLFNSRLFQGFRENAKGRSFDFF